MLGLIFTMWAMRWQSLQNAADSSAKLWSVGCRVLSVKQRPLGIGLECGAIEIAIQRGLIGHAVCEAANFR